MISKSQVAELRKHKVFGRGEVKDLLDTIEALYLENSELRIMKKHLRDCLEMCPSCRGLPELLDRMFVGHRDALMTE